MSEALLVPFRVIKSAIADWWRDWVNLTALNLAWILCWLTVVLGPPSTFVIYHIADNLIQGQSLHLRELPTMVGRCFLKSWLWMLPNLLLAAGIWLNLQFYSRLKTFWAEWAELLSLLLGVLWLLLQFYALPYLMKQERFTLRQAYRNALFTVLASPLYSLIVGAFAALIIYLSTRFIVLLFLGGPVLIVMLGMHAVTERLRTYRVPGHKNGNH